MRIVPAARLASIAPSGTIALADRARRLRALGREIVDLTSGAPNMMPARNLRRALHKALDSDVAMSSYVDSRGLPALRDAIAASLSREWGSDVGADQVVVTMGAKQAIFAWCQAFLSPGDEVIVPSPAWMTYHAAIMMSGAIPVAAPLAKVDRGYAFGLAAIEAAVTPRTRALVLNAPHNPTGALAAMPALTAIAALAKRHSILLLADESLISLVYDGAVQVSAGLLADAADLVTVVRSFSKTYCVPGWRLGYAVGPPQLIAPLLEAHRHMVTCVPGFVQAGALEAMRMSKEERRGLLDLLSERRRRLAEGLSRIYGIECGLPPSGLFCFADVRGTGMDDQTFAERALDEAQVAVVPGSVFGSGGEGRVRIAFARQDETDIDTALSRIDDLCRKAASR